MSPIIVNVWKLLWPDGIIVSDYEKAFKMFEILETLHEPQTVKEKIIERLKPISVSNSGYLTTEQVAKDIGVTKDTIYFAVKKGYLAATHKGKSAKSGLMISKDSLENYKKKRAE